MSPDEAGEAAHRFLDATESLVALYRGRGFSDLEIVEAVLANAAGAGPAYRIWMTLSLISYLKMRPCDDRG